MLGPSRLDPLALTLDLTRCRLDFDEDLLEPHLHLRDHDQIADVEVHEHILVNGETGYLHEPMLHEDFKDLSHFIDRHNRYSSWDAKMRERLAAGDGSVDSIKARFFGAPVERKRFLKKVWLRLPCKPLMRFLYMYFFRLGFLDGRAGFIYSAFKAVQEFHIGAKQYEASLHQRQQLLRRSLQALAPASLQRCWAHHAAAG